MNEYPVLAIAERVLLVAAMDIYHPFAEKQFDDRLSKE
jgi:hypothetical protein